MFNQKTSNILDSSIKYVGSISAFITVIWAFYPEITSFPFLKNYPILALLIVFAFSILLACLKEIPKRKVSIPISNKHNMNIYYGDVLSEDGIIVVPVNEYFDTIVDNEIISESSLHGKFIETYYRNRREELDIQIQNSLDGVEHEYSSTRKKGKKLKYPLGTVCKIDNGKNVFYLVALTHFNENHRASVSHVEYKKVILDILEYIKEHSQGQKVSMPLIGDGRASLTSFTQETLLENLIFNIKTTESLSVEGGLNIVLFKSEGSTIDLYYFDRKYKKN